MEKISEIEKLKKIIDNIESILNLINGNEYENYFIGHLLSIKYEAMRQLTNLQTQSKIKE